MTTTIPTPFSPETGPHTPPPWRVEKGTGLVWGNCTVFDDGTPDRLGVPVTDGQLERAWSKGSGPTYDEMEANAAFIVKAVNNHDDLVAEVASLKNELEVTKAIHRLCCKEAGSGPAQRKSLTKEGINAAIKRIRDDDEAQFGNFIGQKYYDRKEVGEWWTYYAGFSLTKFAERLLAALAPGNPGAANEIHSSDGLCPVPPDNNKSVSPETASGVKGEADDSPAARRTPDTHGSLAQAIGTTQCEDRASPGPSETSPSPATQPQPDSKEVREAMAKALQQFWQGPSGRPWDGTPDSCCVKLPPQAEWFRKLADIALTARVDAPAAPPDAGSRK